MIKSVGALKNVWKIADLRQKMLFTLLILAVYRIGCHIPTPFINPEKLREFMERQRSGAGGGLFQVVDLFSGSAFRNMSVLALGIMPYISVSIILQLLTVVWPKLQKIQQEGALGQRRINRMTRNWTIALAVFQSAGIAAALQNDGLSYFTGPDAWIFYFTSIVAMTTGTAFVMWLGERITDSGIGNGMSMIIAVGIMAHFPSDAAKLLASARSGNASYIWLPFTAVLFVVSTMAIVMVQEGTRRIPMQHAKRVVGRRVLQGGTNYLPLKVNTANVIPVIFASALLSFPGFIASLVSNSQDGGAMGNFFSLRSNYSLLDGLNALGFNQEGVFLIFKSFNAHIILFALLTGFFCYFYTAVAFNPDDVANNLKKSGSFIPGKRPGKPTSEYIDYVLTRITTVGAVFLVTIAVVPQILEVSFNMPMEAASFVGGTGLIIVIGVILDTLKQIESQLLMRHYEGFVQRRSTAARWR